MVSSPDRQVAWRIGDPTHPQLCYARLLFSSPNTKKSPFQKEFYPTPKSPKSPSIPNPAHYVPMGESSRFLDFLLATKIRCMCPKIGQPNVPIHLTVYLAVHLTVYASGFFWWLRFYSLAYGTPINLKISQAGGKSFPRAKYLGPH